MSMSNCPKCAGLLMEDPSDPADPAAIKCVECGREYRGPEGPELAMQPDAKPYNQPALTEAQEVRGKVLAELQALAHEYRPPDADFFRKWVRSKDIHQMLRTQRRSAALIRKALGIRARKMRGPGDHNPVNYLLLEDAKRIISHR